MKTILLSILLAVSAQATTTIPVTNTNWYFSPYTSYSDGAATLGSNNVRTDATKVIWSNAGYFQASFTGSATLVVSVAETGIASGAVRWSIDNLPTTTTALSGSDTTITLAASGLATGAVHSVWFELADAYGVGGNRWNSPPTQSLQITGLVLDTGGSIVTPTAEVAQRPSNVLVFGDSISEGTSWNGVGTFDATRSYAYSLARTLNAEIGQIGFSNQGWITATGAIPQFTSSWNLYFTGATRLGLGGVAGKLFPIPDAIFVNHGTNDTTSVQAAATAWIAAARAAVNPTTPIFIMIPFNGTHKAELTAAVAAAADPFTYLIDIGLVLAPSGVVASPVAGRWSIDGVHPSGEGAGWIGGMVAFRAAYVAITAGSSFFGQTSIRGGVVIH
jgi:lysophospholipase L1-like esterase